MGCGMQALVTQGAEPPTLDSPDAPLHSSVCVNASDAKPWRPAALFTPQPGCVCVTLPGENLET